MGKYIGLKYNSVGQLGDTVEAQRVDTGEGTLHYTLDGTAPSLSSPVYSGLLTLQSTVIRIALLDNAGVALESCYAGLHQSVTADGVAIKRVSTWPLTNVVHRRLRQMQSDGTVIESGEVAMMNVEQVVVYQTVVTSFALRIMTHVSDIFLISQPVQVISFSAVDHLKWVTDGRMSDRVPVQTVAQAFAWRSPVHDRLVTLDHIAEAQTMLTGTQTLTWYVPVHNVIVTTTISSDGLSLPSSVQIWDLSERVADCLVWSSEHKSEPILGLPMAQMLLYGVDNTFYSLYGMFGFLRYREWSLMDTQYHIMIGEHGVNFYDANMDCQYSFKLGYQKTTVDSALLKTTDDQWLLPDQIPLIYHDMAVSFYDRRTRRLCTYDFANVAYATQKYFLIDSEDLPTTVHLYMDYTYGMPYVLPKGNQAGQVITETGQFWNFLQLDCLKLIDDSDTRVEAEVAYVHELFGPVAPVFEQMVMRYGDDFYLLATIGDTQKELYKVNKYAPSDFKLILSYSGGPVLYADYPHVYYAERREEFKLESQFDRLVKFDVVNLDFETRDVECDAYRLAAGEKLWHVYKRSDTHAWYAKRDDTYVVYNLTARFNLGANDVIDAVVFGDSDLYVVTSDRKVWHFESITMTSDQITVTGTPMKLIKFDETVGCVLTRTGSNMAFEQLQQLRFSTRSIDWRTPADMLPGELMWPYLLRQSVAYMRTAPIGTILDCLTTELFSQTLVELEFSLSTKVSLAVSAAGYVPVRIGITSQAVYSVPERSIVNPIVFEAGAMQYNKSLDVDATLQDDETFDIAIAGLPFPEVPGVGFKIYEK